MQHILFAHGAYFMDKYGSLEIWSTQGMEKSHYRARGVYFKNTRHGGGRVRSYYLEEMFNWFFRNTFGRKIRMERANNTMLARVARRRARATNEEEEEDQSNMDPASNGELDRETCV
jgi:hypothetical protein